MSAAVAKSPREDRRDDRRDCILGIAREVFKEQGYAAASMSAIAARLGGSKGTLYNYFRSKADLFTAVVQDLCESHQAYLFDLAENQDLPDYLTTLGGRFARMMLGEDVISYHRTVVAEATRFPEIGQALYEAGAVRGKKRLVEYFRRAIAEGRMHCADPERAAEQAMDLVLTGHYKRRLWNIGPPPTEAEIDASVASGVAVFLAAYGPKG